MAKNNETTVNAEVVEVKDSAVNEAEAVSTKKNSLMDKIKNTGRSVKDFVVKHKEGLVDTALVTASAATLVVLAKLTKESNETFDRANDIIEAHPDVFGVEVVDAESTDDTDTEATEEVQE